MEINKKVNHEKTDTSLLENMKQHRLKTSKVNIQNSFYNELLKRHKSSKYIPEGEIVEIFKIPGNSDNTGLECNYFEPATPIQSKLDHL